MHWFLTACHELAHNWVRAHNSAFADLTAELALRFAPRLYRLYPAASI